MKNESEKVFGVLELAAELGVHPSTLSRYLREWTQTKGASGMPHRRDFKNRYRVTERDVEKWVENLHRTGNRKRGAK